MQAAQGGFTPSSALTDRRRSRRRRRLALVVGLGAMLVLLPLASTAADARSAAAADATLEVIVTGVGNATDPVVPAVTCVVEGGGACTSANEDPPTGEPCKVTNMGNGFGCRYTIGVGQRATLARASAAGFVGWSEFDCEGADACAVTMDSNRTVVATWTPTSLTIAGAFGATPNESVTAKASDGETKIVCTPSTDCTSTTFKAFDEVTLTAEPAEQFKGWIAKNDSIGVPSSAPNYYLAACHEEGDSPTCTLRLTGNDVVGAMFKDYADPEDPDNTVSPPRKKVTLRVVVEPKAAGTVTSSRSRLSDAINCGSYCSATFEQDEHPRLTADAAAGSRFVRWQGGGPFCVSDTTCRYPALRATSIKAVFGPAPQPQPPPPPPPSSPPPSTVKCQVPAVKGRLLRVARNRIRSAHCSVGKIRWARSKKQRGRVIAQKPLAGKTLPLGGRVSLVVSRGHRRR
jgi:PASTA domain-containing protein/List-Bact-rpt repeat protein